LALKIPLLLVQYLYKNRKMPLPGLGIFTLDKSVVLPEENDRVLLSMPNAVQFQNANIAAADKELITFICENTGKITPLAISDLDSYLNLGTEMLNIGKPFHLEGIGTITKNKSGKFDFAPGEYTLIKETVSGSDSENKRAHPRGRRQVSAPSQSRIGLKVIAVIAAVIVVALGGWLMYKKNSPARTENVAVVDTAVQQLPTDSLVKDSVRKDSLKTITKDTSHALPAASTDQPTNYKFIVLATENKPHALKRYSQLLGFDLKVHLSQKDSTFFKVYFQFPALPKDTTHIKDSLRREYAHSIIIEQ
jgi:hypothetical protein